MTKLDKRMFGEIPDDFKQLIATALREEEDELMKMKHKSIGGVWILAIILLLLMGTALAVTASFGVLDFKKPANPEVLQENVQDLTSFEAAETALVHYQVQDALIDGGKLLFTIVCEPKNPDKYMLIPFDDPNVGIAPGSEKTYAQLAKETSKEMVHVKFPDVSVNGGLHMTRGDQNIQDGKLYWLLEPGAILMEGTNEVVCKLYDSPIYGAKFVKETDKSLGVEGYHIPDVGEGSESTLTFSIDNVDKAAKVETVRFTGPIETEYAIIDWVEYTHGNLSTDLRVQFTVHEDLSKEDSEAIKFMNFRLLNNPDETRGVTMTGSRTRMDGKNDDNENFAGVTFLQEWTGEAIDTLPDTIYLRPKYTGGVFGEVITLPISEGEMVGN